MEIQKSQFFAINQINNRSDYYRYVQLYNYAIESICGNAQR